LKQHCGRWVGGDHFEKVLYEVGQKMLAKRGDFYCRATQYNDNPVIEYFVSGSDEQALDFIELCFQTSVFGVDNDFSRGAVAELNRIFEEEGIGYELTPPSTVDDGPGILFGRTSPGLRVAHIEYPKVIMKDECTVHEKAVKLALETLRDPRLATANSELLDAFAKVRSSNYSDAITSCCAAFESVLKTICEFKGWA
jgi:hypothetical protein